MSSYPQKLNVRHHAIDHFNVTRMDSRIVTQMTFTLGALLGEDMTTERLRSFKSARGSASETLGCATIGFHLRHDAFLQLSVFFKNKRGGLPFLL
jgi:hypothetical protein